jgi:tape measure domain-containing protein
VGIRAAELEARISADDRALGKGLDRAEGKLKSFSGVGSAAGKIVAAGLLSVTAAATGLVGTGVKIAADMEQAKIGFTTMLGSAQKADAFIRDLQDFAAKTPFEFPGLQRAAGQFLGAGLAAKDVIPTMRVLGDAIAGVGGGEEQINAAVRALGQMQQKGKITGEEMLQLAEAGVPAWGALAAQMGVSIPEAQKKVSAGQVKVNELIMAIEKSAGPLAKTKGLMDAQSASLKGMLSTLKDVIGQGLGQIAGPIVQGLKSALPEVTESITTLMQTAGPALAGAFGGIIKTFGAILPALAPVLKMFGEFIGQLGEELVPVISRVAKFLPDLIEPFAGLFETILPIIDPLAELFFNVLGAAMPILRTIGNLFRILIPPITAIVSILVGALEPIFQAIGEVMEEVGFVLEQLATAFAEILSAIAPLIPPLIKALLPAFTAILDILVELLPALLPIIELFTELAVMVLPPLIKILTFVIGIIQRVRAVLITGLGKALVAVVGWIGTGLGKIVGFFRGISGQADAFLAGWRRIVGFLAEAWNNTWENMKNGVKGIWNGIVSAVKGGVNIVLALIESAVNAFLLPLRKLSTAPVIGKAIPDVPTIKIPRLHDGGISMGGLAQLAPREAAIPLDNPKAVAMLREALAGLGGGGAPIIIQPRALLGTKEDVIAWVQEGLLRKQARTVTTGIG